MAEPVPPPSRRPFYYPAGLGCLFWVVVLLLVWLLVGFLFEPAWWPGW